MKDSGVCHPSFCLTTLLLINSGDEVFFKCRKEVNTLLKERNELDLQNRHKKVEKTSVGYRDGTANMWQYSGLHQEGCGLRTASRGTEVY